MTEVHYPNESPEYRKARQELLAAELDLRGHVERVAALRRALPPGGELKQDYRFRERIDGADRETRLSQLFGDKDALFIYSFMYTPTTEACPLCTSILDGLDAQVIHIRRQISFAVVAKNSLDAIHDHARSRGWTHLRLVSSQGTTYNEDYYGEADGRQVTNANVFVRSDRGIRHFWGAEMTLAPMIEGGNMRHLDLMWPLWNVLDTTPGGRGNWYPQLSYESE